MKKGSLAPYLLFSFIVHAGFLVGAHEFLKLSPEEVEQADLIPVEIGLLEEEAPPLQPTFAITEQSVTPKALGTISDTWTGSTSDRYVEDVEGPVPAEVVNAPLLTGRNAPSLAVISDARRDEMAASRPLLDTPKMVPLEIAPVGPSTPMDSSPAEIKGSETLFEARAEIGQAYALKPEKIEAPLARSLPRAETVSEPSPILVMGSPSISERRETTMALAADVGPEGRPRTPIHRGFIPASQPSAHVAREKGGIDPPTSILPNAEPAALILSRFRFPGSERGAAYLLLIDTSGSVKGTPLDGIKKSAKEFISLMGENDRAGVMTFNDEVELVRSFTAERQALKQEIGKLRTAGTQTALFDALVTASDIMSREDNEGRFIVLISDGKDEGSHSTLADVIEATRRSGVSILSIGYSKIQKEYLAVLRKLAEETGGDFVHAPEFNDVLALYRMSRDISDDETVKSASLEVKSDPIGAQVYVDGKLKGKTPLHLELSIGKHDFFLILPNHHDWKATILLEEGVEIPLYVRLLPVE